MIFYNLTFADTKQSGVQFETNDIVVFGKMLKFFCVINVENDT